MRGLSLWLLSFAAAASLAMGCGRSWPTVRPLGDPTFMARSHVRTVDVLPLDVEIGTGPTRKESPEQVADVFYGSADAAVVDTLMKRGYLTGAMFDWDGQYEGTDLRTVSAMPREDVAVTAQALAMYGQAQAQRPGEILFPYLPAHLGDQTGSDATLYVGGFGFAGKDPRRITGSDVAKGILIAALIVVVVVVIVAAARSGGGGGGALGGIGRAAGNAAQATGRVMVSAGRAALQTTGQVARVGVRVLGEGLRGMNNVNLDIHVEAGHDDDPMIDAYGRPYQRAPAEAAPIAPAAPLADKAAEMPVTGRSKIFLEMTLVDNHNGRVLWHARQIFDASPAKPGDVQECVRRMLRTLPVAGQSEAPTVAVITNR